MQPISRKKRVGFTPTEFEIGMTNTVTKRNVRMSCPRADSVDASMALTTVSDTARDMDESTSGNRDTCVDDCLELVFI